MTAQLNFNGINKFWQYLLLQLNKTLPNMTLSDHFSTQCPYPAAGFPTLALSGAILHQPLTLIPFKLSADAFKEFPNIWQKQIRDHKLHWCPFQIVKKKNQDILRHNSFFTLKHKNVTSVLPFWMKLKTLLYLFCFPFLYKKIPANQFFLITNSRSNLEGHLYNLSSFW